MMEIYCTKLYEQLTTQLTDLESLYPDPVVKAREAVNLVAEALRHLREHFAGHQWECSREEITFFKQIKPRFQSRMIYYLKIFHLESRALALAPQAFRDFLQEELAKITQFFAGNQEFCQYYKTGARYLDEYFFVRGQADLNLVDEDLYMALDPAFSTIHSYKVSRMLAYNALSEYIKRRITLLAADELLERSDAAMNWTATKADLVELLYALYAAGAINHSRIGLHAIARLLEAVFSIKLGNYYRVFQDIRTRKKNRTPFLDTLKEMLVRKMDTGEVMLCEG